MQCTGLFGRQDYRLHFSSSIKVWVESCSIFIRSNQTFHYSKEEMATLRLLFLVAALFCCSCRCQRLDHLDCTIWEARRYRDCTCGVQYRDIEKHCQDDHTYFQPLLRYESLECEFECQNGGIRHVLDPIDEVYLCDCRRRGFGECCQKGKILCLAKQVN